METIEEANHKLMCKTVHKTHKISQTLPLIRTRRRSKYHSLARRLEGHNRSMAKIAIDVGIRVAEEDLLVRMMIEIISRIYRILHDKTSTIITEIKIRIQEINKIQDRTIETKIKASRTTEEIKIHNKTTAKVREPGDVSRRRSH